MPSGLLRLLRGGRRLLVVPQIVVAGFLAMPSIGHELSPVLLSLEETQGGVLAVVWKSSLLRKPGAHVQPVLPVECKTVTKPVITESADGTAATTRWSVHCGGAKLAGLRVGVEGLDRARIDALVRARLADGELFQGVLRAGRSFITIPAEERLVDIIGDYMRLGFTHILSGLDHLLFVFGLLLLAAGPRMLIKTVTAFTVGHSITLSLAALGFVRFPSGPIEVAIAISILALAVELARSTPETPTLMRRLPWVMAGLFGLLHGFGFAGALASVGLPEQEIPLALFAFNIGIELGQLAFVFALLAAYRVLDAALDSLPDWVAQAPVYGMGSLSAFWCLQRTAILFP